MHMFLLLPHFTSLLTYARTDIFIIWQKDSWFHINGTCITWRRDGSDCLAQLSNIMEQIIIYLLTRNYKQKQRAKKINPLRGWWEKLSCVTEVPSWEPRSGKVWALGATGAISRSQGSGSTSGKKKKNSKERIIFYVKAYLQMWSYVQLSIIASIQVSGSSSVKKRNCSVVKSWRIRDMKCVWSSLKSNFFCYLLT